MKKIFLLFLLIPAFSIVFAEHVPQREAHDLAIRFFNSSNPAGPGLADISESFESRYNNVITYYTFNFSSGGFVMVAADDACEPILGYSFTGQMPREITNPAAREWFESYSKEISRIIENRLPNTETGKIWNSIRNGIVNRAPIDVNPLLTTLWDQGCYYNALCPSDPSSVFTCGHVYTGCVATAMAQIMKYHNFPPQGVGSHSYTHPTYGLQTANFGATTYNWSAMPNSVGSSNTAVATIMYHAGVSVNMQYDPSGSGAYSDDVPDAMWNYFNYHPDINIIYKDNYPNAEDFKNMLRADLDQSLPIYYSGSGSGGHAFVCDGYRMSDGKFHFNWGWSGSSNGWFTIGALNPGGSNFNDNNAAVIHIKPYNPNLIVRVSHPVDNAVTGVGYPVTIEGVTVRGTPTVMKLFIDNVETFITSNDTIEYTWSTTPADLGSHQVKIVSLSATDTVYDVINLNVAEWISQPTGFSTANRALNFMSAVDSNIVWATAGDDANPTGACSDFSRSTDGGTTWTPGTITNTQGLASAMIFAVDANTAYVPMYKVSGTKPMGIYATFDGGTTWSRQTSASFSNSASFPNCVHFFNASDGWCMGDPIGGEFEIYTTGNGGTTWTAVAGPAIPNPLSGEFGVVGYYSAIGDTIWFGTNLGRVYRSTDKGHNFTVSGVTPLSGKYLKPAFRNGSHGLVQDKSSTTTGAICETFDGGLTWSLITPTGPVYPTDLLYVPGTENTWVSTGGSGSNGASYSFDGGHTWTDFQGTQGARYLQMTWVNNHCGWAGGVNVSSTENGTYKFIGLLMPPLPPPTDLNAQVIVHDVYLTWNPPATSPLGYNIYRNGLKLNSSPLVAVNYDDLNVMSGQYTYCVKAVYSAGESESDCEVVDVAVGIQSTVGLKQVKLTPNPASAAITLSQVENGTYVISSLAGIPVLKGRLTSPETTIALTGLAQGVYFLRIPETGLIMKFIIAD